MKRRQYFTRRLGLVAAAFGAVAVGAFAIGALAIQHLAIKSVVVESAAYKSLEVYDPTVTRLRAAEVACNLLRT